MRQTFNYYNKVTKLDFSIVTYENDEESKSKTLDARSYMRYYDANGKLRVFYNNYNNNASYYGGCMCSYNQVLNMNS